MYNFINERCNVSEKCMLHLFIYRERNRVVDVLVTRLIWYDQGLRWFDLGLPRTF